jgi:hypothetical protein
MCAIHLAQLAKMQQIASRYNNIRAGATTGDLK